MWILIGVGGLFGLACLITVIYLLVGLRMRQQAFRSTKQPSVLSVTQRTCARQNVRARYYANLRGIGQEPPDSCSLPDSRKRARIEASEEIPEIEETPVRWQVLLFYTDRRGMLFLLLGIQKSCELGAGPKVSLVPCVSRLVASAALRRSTELVRAKDLPRAPGSARTTGKGCGTSENGGGPPRAPRKLN